MVFRAIADFQPANIEFANAFQRRVDFFAAGFCACTAQAFNQYLGASSETAQLFESIDRDAPEFARECSNLALEALVEAGKFSLAAKYLTDPVARVATLAERLNHDVARIPERPRSKSPRYRAYTWNFALDLRTIIAILSGAARGYDADDCRARAFAILKPWYVRKAVERALASEA